MEWRDVSYFINENTEDNKGVTNLFKHDRVQCILRAQVVMKLQPRQYHPPSMYSYLCLLMHAVIGTAMTLGGWSYGGSKQSS